MKPLAGSTLIRILTLLNDIRSFPRRIDGALGFGDPREIRDYLEEHGTRCWLDIDRVGKVTNVSHAVSPLS